MMTALEQALNLVKEMSPLDKVRLVEKVMDTLERDLTAENPQSRPTGYGILSKVNVSSDDIDEIRREMWANFPREDIG